MPNSARWILVLILLFAGGEIGYLLQPKKSASDTAEDLCASVRQNVNHFSATELEEYLRLKTERRNCEKSDELLGKLMLILLRDLGLRLSSRVLDFAHDSPRGGVSIPLALKTPPPTLLPTSIPTPQKSPERDSERPLPHLIDVPPPSPTPDPAASLLVSAQSGVGGSITLDHLGGDGREDKSHHLLGWFRDPESSVDFQTLIGGVTPGGLAVIRAERLNARGFGSLTCVMDPQPFLDTQIRFIAWIKTDNIDDSGEVFVRADAKNLKRISLARRSFKGTSKDWTKYEILTTAPKETTKLFFGFTLNGHGMLEVKDVSLASVGAK